ncbi:hypothetical protein ABBQ32_000824 [Trebouxia sp. C0010 RCD-2024]
MTLRALVRYKCWKAAFQRTATYDYHGTPDTQGARGRLRMFKVVQAETAVQPKETLRTPEGSARLNSGHNIPRIGLGTWKSEKGQVRHAVYEALKAGYRHVDCAAIYENEHEIHWPVTGNIGPEVAPALKQTWKAMELLVKEGLVRSIGVSNFSVKKLESILSYAEIPPAVCQVECHPYFRNEGLLQWCKARHIHVTAYSPLGSPDSASMFRRKAPLLLQDPIVTAVANKLSRSPAQVLIRWSLQHGTSVLPKSTSAERIKANMDVMSWALCIEDYNRLCDLSTQMRMVNGSFWLHPKGPYVTLNDLWDEDECSSDAHN